MTTMKRFRGLAAAALALGFVTFAGCNNAPHSSTLTGKVDLQSFSSTDVHIVAANDQGKAMNVPVAEDGSFSVKLGQGSNWGLFVVSGQETIPVVLRQRDAQLEGTVEVETGGATADLGTLSFWSRASSMSAARPTIQPSPSQFVRRPADPTAVVATPPASQGQAVVSCASGHDDMEGGCPGGHGFHKGSRAHDRGDMMMRVDAPALQTKVDASSALVVSTFDLPDSIQCAKYADDDDDDDFDGEHDDD